MQYHSFDILFYFMFCHFQKVLLFLLKSQFFWRSYCRFFRLCFHVRKFRVFQAVQWYYLRWLVEELIIKFRLVQGSFKTSFDCFVSLILYLTVSHHFPLRLNVIRIVIRSFWFLNFVVRRQFIIIVIHIVEQTTSKTLVYSGRGIVQVIIHLNY